MHASRETQRICETRRIRERSAACPRSARVFFLLDCLSPKFEVVSRFSSISLLLLFSSISLLLSITKMYCYFFLFAAAKIWLKKFKRRVSGGVVLYRPVWTGDQSLKKPMILITNRCDLFLFLAALVLSEKKHHCQTSRYPET